MTPPHPPYASPIKTGASPLPLPSVRIELRTAQTRDLKLIATLRPTRLTPLTSKYLLLALSRQPFSLFLSFARIVWHAAILHYRRRLDVYVRPEPRAISSKVEKMVPADHNKIQPAAYGELGVGGGTGWQLEGLFERYARNIVENFVMRRALEMGIWVTLESTNPAYGRKCFPCDPVQEKTRDATGTPVSTNHLHIAFRSPLFFTILLSCPSAAHALLLGVDAERIFSVSDEVLFSSVFSVDDSRPSSVGVRRATQRHRLMAVPQSLRPPRSNIKQIPYIHPLDASLPFFPALLNFFVVFQLLKIPQLERMLFTFFRARFVPGLEPWAGWTRAEEAVWKRNSSKNNANEGDDEIPSLGSRRRP